ncbi:uncharacterized protein LOC103954087 [Pyrus x bretschneideri]|uniref:uncharacterized protein LOC103954087 n=1 Tax=Pyrus x bretschneideri TaxID=225117 RepID=UPI0020305632|nr:uncharacterized protein LOC103954087 [Pyrus x bretschneideri]XP_048426036.1 uncharacterized protein LOC103954087 [Pyrus x bretschneideri]XP_048426037.1 uncharacterized protein LOC103954087 [Pyrus x bretschneideri]XP_048426038.1 uncharacterized protein LOC103954087 [Pyrus x bretschneideri]XP_048426040.1 uncharacterized protein LOC103954087 [Pyrus x bretschneideri]XP_048426041.1 uncharacterized protein LOC103954087 [Pyrus x bretschneideri]XP_048426042.1 uncharacterized protein LOC103954087 [
MSMTVNSNRTSRICCCPISGQFCCEQNCNSVCTRKAKGVFIGFHTKRRSKVSSLQSSCRGGYTFSYFSNWKQCRDSVKRTGSILKELLLSSLQTIDSVTNILFSSGTTDLLSVMASGKFVLDSGVTILGTIPSLVKAWKSTISFSSTGEMSS